MRKITRITSIFLLTIAAVSCNDMDKHYFNGEIVQVDRTNVITKNVTSELVSLCDEYTGMTVAAYDSLLVCWAPSAKDFFYNIFNVDTGEKIGSFCAKGNGPNEFLTAGCVYQFYNKEDDLMTLVNDLSKKKVYTWNISESINQGKTLYDTIVPYDNGHMLWQFFMPDNIVFDYKSSLEQDDYNVSTPYYEKRNIFTNELVQSYKFYNTETVQNSLALSPLYSWDVMKPDGKKIVQVMRYFPQINILDTHDSKLVGYRTKSRPTFSLLNKSPKSVDVFYTYVHADDNYIYAIYLGYNPSETQKSTDSGVIHVFDWNGNFVYELITDRRYFNLWSDPVRNRLYSINSSLEEVYFIDLNGCL